jgi:hypothetical protein
MTYLIGTDEAGYGPNLGPLVIAASVWRVPADLQDEDLYQALGPVVADRPTLEPDRLAIADSKLLYRPGGDLAQLERGLLTALSAVGPPPTTWQELSAAACLPATRPPRPLPWSSDTRVVLPTSPAGASDERLRAGWRCALQAAGVCLLDLKAIMIEPEEFNAGVAQFDSKGTLLSNRTLDLIAQVTRGLDDRPLRIVCDKHGGRNKYAPLLQPRFDDRLVRVVREGRAASIYELGEVRRPIQISFRVGGESFLPSALASMLAKYLRELSMLAFNAYWQRQLPELRPTAGYPVDARRFWDEIRERQRQLEIDDTLIWRCR